MKGEITYLGITTEFTRSSLEFYRNIKWNGKPTTQVLFGGFNFTIPTNKEGLRFLEELLKIDIEFYDENQPDPTPSEIFKPFTVQIYDEQEHKTRNIELIDAHIKNYREVFSTFQDYNGEINTSMFIDIKVVSAIQRINKKALNVFRWYYSDYGLEENQSPVVATEQKDKVDLKFIARFERINGTYNGEFGFDWMRDNYKDICEDYEKLKKEYFPTSIHEEEYFVPSLNMFPNQGGVKLKLKIDKKEGTIKDDDIIKLPSKGGIRFEPDKVKISEADGKQITVICDSPLSKDTMINLLDKDDKTVGKLNVFKNANHEQLHFNIIPVRILRGVSKQNDIDTIENQIDIKGTITRNGIKEKVKGWGDKGKDLSADLKNLENYLNKNSLNQALLKCAIGKVYDIIIDENEWISDDLIIDEGCVFKDNVVLDKFYEEFEKQHPIEAKKRGLIVFLSPIKQEKAGGEGDLYDVDAKHCAIYNSNLWDKTSFVHELSHVMGLQHNFYKTNEKNNADLIKKYEEEYIQPRKDNVKILKNNIEIYKENILKQRKSISKNSETLNTQSNSVYFKQNPDKKQGFISAINQSKKSISEQEGKIIKAKERIIKIEQKISDLEATKWVYIENKYKFNQGQTENIMDYRSKRISFYKWQWKILNDEMVKYYNE